MRFMVAYLIAAALCLQFVVKPIADKFAAMDSAATFNSVAIDLAGEAK